MTSSCRLFSEVLSLDEADMDGVAHGVVEGWRVTAAPVKAVRDVRASGVLTKAETMLEEGRWGGEGGWGGGNACDGGEGGRRTGQASAKLNKKEDGSVARRGD